MRSIGRKPGSVEDSRGKNEKTSGNSLCKLLVLVYSSRLKPSRRSSKLCINLASTPDSQSFPMPFVVVILAQMEEIKKSRLCFGEEWEQLAIVEIISYLYSTDIYFLSTMAAEHQQYSV